MRAVKPAMLVSVAACAGYKPALSTMTHVPTGDPPGTIRPAG